MNSRSEFVSLTCSFLPAKTDPLVCIDFFLKGAQKMLSILFPQESLCHVAGHSVQLSVSLIKIDCFLHITKHLTTLDNNISTESLDEQCIEIIHVLMCETQ